MSISSQLREELTWWIDSIETASTSINRGEVDITLTSDTSKQGWSAATGDSSPRGLWMAEEAKEHINFLEMLAVLFALKSFRTLTHGKHVKVIVDNTVTESSINQMGSSHSPKLNKSTKDIWEWCIQQHKWLTVARIPGCENVEADRESFRRYTEWCLKKSLFTHACPKLSVIPDIDLFASRINCQITPYVSYRADPEAFAINAFHMSWQPYLVYAFPPFSLITSSSKDPRRERHRASTCAKMANPAMVAQVNADVNPTTSTTSKRTATLCSYPATHRNSTHSIRMVLCHFSGGTLTAKTFRQQLPQSLNNPGGQAQESSMLLTFKNGDATAVQGTFIHFIPL